VAEEVEGRRGQQKAVFEEWGAVLELEVEEDLIG
jgi:hypothetical protein